MITADDFSELNEAAPQPRSWLDTVIVAGFAALCIGGFVGSLVNPLVAKAYEPALLWFSLLLAIFTVMAAFKDGLGTGLATMFVPFYVFYYVYFLCENPRIKHLTTVSLLAHGLSQLLKLIARNAA